ncbi:hypothetical protein D9611_000569 [Ephemerocybe angulata]|uniref:Uncharacterized protein n=1 Tax=Ephemerocybe angulata TaxID=980116 RepID=A0A8H5BNY0_9AGAR|nr:hypothetical protein D9611_000569 [Tulosesus angulatus]
MDGRGMQRDLAPHDDPAYPPPSNTGPFTAVKATLGAGFEPAGYSTCAR